MYWPAYHITINITFINSFSTFQHDAYTETGLPYLSKENIYRQVFTLYMRTCCKHRNNNNNHSVANVYRISGELQVSNYENVFKRPSPWSSGITRKCTVT